MYMCVGVCMGVHIYLHTNMHVCVSHVDDFGDVVFSCYYIYNDNCFIFVINTFDMTMSDNSIV